MKSVLLSAAALAALLLSTVIPESQRAMAVPLPPKQEAPNSGTRLDTFGTTLRWSYPAGSPTKQVQLQVAPFNNDGAAIDLILDAATVNSFNIPAPPDWFGMLPDITYTWKMRGSEATTPIDATSPSWGPWTEPGFTFRTPKVLTTDVFPLTPANGTSSNTTPTLVWKSVNEALFYYEVQVSTDDNFDTNPATAKASVYWNLVHGGVTNPPNSYAVPASSPLISGKTYYWRVRPRVQGDGTPMQWSNVFQFRAS